MSEALTVLDTPDTELDGEYMPVQFAKAMLAFVHKEGRYGLENCLVERDGETIKFTATDGHGLVQITSPHCDKGDGVEGRLIHRDTLKEYVASKGHSPLSYFVDDASAFPAYNSVIPVLGSDGGGQWDGECSFGISTHLWSAVNKVMAALGKGKGTSDYTPMIFQGTAPLAPFRIDVKGHAPKYTSDTAPFDVLMVIMPMRTDS